MRRPAMPWRRRPQAASTAGPPTTEVAHGLDGQLHLLAYRRLEGGAGEDLRAEVLAQEDQAAVLEARGVEAAGALGA